MAIFHSTKYNPVEKHWTHSPTEYPSSWLHKMKSQPAMPIPCFVYVLLNVLVKFNECAEALGLKWLNKYSNLNYDVTPNLV